jgi:type-F conjugative transfer system pilin assembly protein TrbC
MWGLKMVIRHMTKGIRIQFKCLLFIVIISVSNSCFALPHPNTSDEDQEWAGGLANQTLKLTMQGIKKKYLELQRMLGVVSEDMTDKEGVEELLKPAAVLRVFVSSSMSSGLLKAYVKEAEKYGAVLVFKGLPNGSWRQLSELVSNISGESDNVAMQIYDEAFSKFGISSVPTFVLSNEPRDNWQEEKKEVFDKVVGNVGIKGALKLMAEQGDMARAAAVILEKRQ